MSRRSLIPSRASQYRGASRMTVGTRLWSEQPTPLPYKGKATVTEPDFALPPPREFAQNTAVELGADPVALVPPGFDQVVVEALGTWVGTHIVLMVYGRRWKTFGYPSGFTEIARRTFAPGMTWAVAECRSYPGGDPQAMRVTKTSEESDGGAFGFEGCCVVLLVTPPTGGGWHVAYTHEGTLSAGEYTLSLPHEIPPGAGPFIQWGGGQVYNIVDTNMLATPTGSTAEWHTSWSAATDQPYTQTGVDDVTRPFGSVSMGLEWVA